jgi:AraC family transcriptional regulator
MNSTHLYIKNMVCNRCIKVVKDELENIGLLVEEIKLGEVRVDGPIDPDVMKVVKDKLNENGFALLDDKKAQIVEKIKSVVIDLVRQSENDRPKMNYSHIIAERVGYDYNYLSTLFSSMESLTIERYTILQRIERVKELLVYDEHTLSEIAFQTGYSSVQHLSAQFKKVTGLTPRHFKEIGKNKRKGLDQVGDH